MRSSSLRTNKPLLPRLVIYCAVVLVSALVLMLKGPSAQIDASVLSLLPRHSVQALPPELEDGLLERLDRQVVLLLGGPKVTTADAHALTQKLEASGYFATVQGELSAEFKQEYGQALYQHRNAWVTPELQAALASGARTEQVLAQLFSPFAGVSAQEIINDPWLVLRDFQLNQLNQAASKLKLHEGWLTTHNDQGHTYFFIRAELQGQAFSIANNAALSHYIQELSNNYHQQGLRLLSRGTVFYSHEAAQLAQRDVTVLGSTTVILVLALIWAVFRSLRPVIMVLISCASGALVAVSATIAIFGGIHLITLTLAVSIVGVSVDYSLYYLTARLTAPKEHSPLTTLQAVQPAIIWALVASVISYGALALTPLTGMRQMAVFAVFGLSGACLTVLCLHPLLAQGIKPDPRLPGQALLTRARTFYTQPGARRWAIPIILTILSLAGLTRYHASDDVATFQQLPPHLVAADQEISELTGQSPDQKWLCVFGHDPDVLLTALDQVRPVLTLAQPAHLITGYQTIPLPSQKQQQQNTVALNAALPQLEQALRSAGLDQALTQYPEATLSLEDYLKSPLALGFELLCLEQEGTWGILVALHGLSDAQAPALTQQAQAAISPDLTAAVALIDRKAAFTQLFQNYRELISWTLLGAVGVIALLFLLTKGLKQGLLELMPAGIALLGAVGGSSLLGLSFTFFSLLALVLVLGIGINYALFFTKAQHQAETTLLAVTLAMLTTMLTFGVLVFSQTQVISTFGVTLVCGLGCAFVTAPLLISPQQAQAQKQGAAHA